MNYKADINLLPQRIRYKWRRRLLAALMALALVLAAAAAVYAVALPYMRVERLKSDIDAINARLAQYNIPELQLEQAALNQRYEALMAVIGSDGSAVTWSETQKRLSPYLGHARITSAEYYDGGRAVLTLEADSVADAMRFLESLSQDGTFAEVTFSDISVGDGGAAEFTVLLGAQGGDGQ